MTRSLKDAEPIVAKAKAERRRYRRVRLDQPGRLFVPREGTEAPCQVVDLSPGGAAIHCDTIPPYGTPVVLYLDGFGRFEGTIARREEEGFGITFVCTQAKRERIAEQLTLFLNKEMGDDTLLRRHERTHHKGFTKFTRADGQIVNCEVMDISVGGVSLKSELRPPMGEYVLIAGIAGRVVRHHEQGVGIEFVGPDKHAPAVEQPSPQKLNIVR
jgi:hypothetical protein